MVLLFSCSGEQEQADSMDFDDFAGETGVQEDNDTIVETVVVEDLSEMGQLIRNMEADYDTVYCTTSHPIDRFSFSTSRKVSFSGKEQVPYGKSNMVTPVADFFYYSFTDSNKTINAFYNYLDRLADDGEGGPVKLNEDVKFIKTPPLFMVVYDTIIVSAKYKCEHEAHNWRAFQDSVLKVYGKDYKYQIDVDCGGPLVWK